MQNSTLEYSGEHLDFNELSANTANMKTSIKKKTQESMISRIVAQQRTNILHRTPFSVLSSESRSPH